MRTSRLLKSTAFFLLLCTPSFAGLNNIEELDGSPSTYPWKLKVSNGSLTDNGDGTATLTVGGGLTVGTSTISSGTNTRVLYDDSGVLGESSGLTFTKATSTLAVGGTLTTGGSASGMSTVDRGLTVNNGSYSVANNGFLRVNDSSGNPLLYTDTTNSRVGVGTTSPTQGFEVTTSIAVGGTVAKYKNVATTGWGVPAIYGTGRSTAQNGAVASVAAYTVGATDSSFLVSANVLITTATLHNFTVTCTYTDEGNTSRTLTIPFTNLAGTALTSITNAAGAVPYEGIPQHIRCKASTSITIASTGTFTTVTYNIEGMIAQIS